MVAEIVIYEAYAEAIAGLEGYSHLFVLFWMHRCDPARYRPMVHPRGREDLPLTGVLSTRRRDRPNPIGLAVVEWLGRTGHCLQVRRLDAYDGTPVIDIKPYDPYDVFTDLRVPDWWFRQVIECPAARRRDRLRRSPDGGPQEVTEKSPSPSTAMIPHL
jgi:tRNA (adenine37-N6)-methyltransferase